MTRVMVLLAFGLLVAQECSPRGLPDSEESVVSVYTTQSNMGANVDHNVYHQIANNIAERIASPIYSFLGFDGKNKTENTTTAKKPWDSIEMLDDPETVTKANQKPMDNEISLDKDVEELSSEARRKIDKKPEKIILYSSYLPSGKIEQLEGNDTTNEISDEDDVFGFDDVEEGSDVPPKKTGPFVYFLEKVGSIIQLIYGGIAALFSSSSRNNN